MKSRIFCIAMALCLTVCLCGCDADDGKIRDNSEAYSDTNTRNTDTAAHRYANSSTASERRSLKENTGTFEDDSTNNQGVTDAQRGGTGLAGDALRGAENAARDITNGAKNIGRDIKDAVTRNGETAARTPEGSSVRSGS